MKKLVKKTTTFNKTTTIPVVVLLFVVIGFVSMRLYGTSQKITEPIQTTAVDMGIDGNVFSPCKGNAPNMCKGSPSIDLYPSGSESASNPYLVEEGTHKQITGRITTIKDKTTVISSTNEEVYAVTFPIDIVTEFNVSRSSGYDGIKIGVGTMITIDYLGSDTSKSIKPSQIWRSAILIKEHKTKADLINSKVELY